MDDRSADESPYLLRGERDVIRLRNPTEDKRALRRMLTSADPSEILENIQYGGSSVVKTDSQRTRFISREAWFRVLLTMFAFIVTFEEFLVLYSKQSIYKCLIS